MKALIALVLLLFSAPAWAASSLIHDLSTSATNPLPVGSCLYVDQNSVDTKLCSNWATAIGALLPSLSNLTATALPSGFTLPSPALTGTVTGANTIPYSILQQAAQRTILGNATTGTANITAGWTVSGDSSKVATTTGTLTNGHCVDIDSVGNFVDAGTTCAAGGGGGSVTSVGVSVPAASIFGVGSSPITTAGTISLTTTGTSGGIPYFSSGTQLSTSAQMPVNHAITGGGAGASPKDSKVTITVPATGSTLTIADGKTATLNATTTFGGVDGKTVTFNNTQTFAGVDATTITFQATDTYVGRATTDTLTNKTYDTAGTGNVFKIAGAQLTAITGTGATVALSASPVFTAPTLGAALATSINMAAPDQSISITPIGNSAGTTLTSLSMQLGTTVSGATREFMVAFGQKVKTGTGVVSPGGDKVTVFAGAEAYTGGGNTWAFNSEAVQINATGGMVVSAEHDIEMAVDVLATLGAAGIAFPTSGGANNYGYGNVVAGGTAHTITSGYLVDGITSGFNRGFTCFQGVNQACFQDDASSTISVDIRGTHTTGIDMSNATISGNALTLPSAVGFITGSGTFTMAGGTLSGSGDTVFQITSSGTGTPNFYLQVVRAATSYLRIYDATNALELQKWTKNGNAVFPTPPILPGYTVAGLPSGTVGMHAYVTNAVACTFLAGVTGGGAVVCPVFYDGTSWKGG